MAKEEGIELEGEVTAAHKNAFFTVHLDNGHDVLCHVCGRIRKFFIKITIGDRVTVEVSPYDLTKGRIVYRQR